jgi:hypothetical protein
MEFPNARIIHMTRDPRDRYASARKRHGQNRARVGAATGRWLFSMRMAKRNQQRYPDSYMVVRYEDLAHHPQDILRQICAFIHEDYTPAMLTMQGAPEYRDRGGNSSFSRFEPGVISTSATGRFRKVLSNSEIAFIELWAGHDMEAFGYQRERVRLAPGERLAFYLVDLPINLARMWGWRMLAAARMKRGVRIPAFRLRDEPVIAAGGESC